MKKQILKDFVLTEISGVDRPAQPTARMAIMKRDTSGEVIAKSFMENGVVTTKSFSQLLTEKNSSKRVWEAREELYPLFDALNDAVSSIVTNKNNSYETKQMLVEASTNEFLAAVRDKLPDVEEELMKFFNDVNAGTSGAINPDDTGENPMPDKVNKSAEELAKELEEVTKSVSELTEKLAEAETLAKMSDAEKAYMDKMSDKEKPAFMAMSAADRAKKIASVAKNDETVEVAGQTISKSEVGDKQFAIFKAQADELATIRKQAETDREAAETAKLEKRATDELPNLPGEVSVKARVLKAIDGLSEEDREAASKMLKSANEVLAKSMETIGRGSDKSDGSVDAEIEKKAEEIAKRDGIGKAAAIAKAWEENPALYEKYEAEHAA